MAAALWALGTPDVGRVVQELAVEVRQLDGVVVDHAEAPDARGREVEGDRGAQGAGADHEDARVAQRELGGRAPLRQRELAGVALDLRVGELAGRALRDDLRRQLVGEEGRLGLGEGVAPGGARGSDLARGARELAQEPAPARAAHRRTIRIVVPSTATSWPASRAERGTLSSASPALQETHRTSPGARRSSATFVLTHVSGQVSRVMSSVSATALTVR